MAVHRKVFEFTWRIENYNLYRSRIRSPAFVINTMENNPWFLDIEPNSETKKGHISFRVGKEKRDPFRKYFIKISFTDDNSALYKGDLVISFNRLASSDLFVPHQEIYSRKRSSLLPPKTLTIRCQIHETMVYNSIVGQCFARTRIQVTRIAFIGSIEDFSYFSSGSGEPLMIKSSSTEKQLFSLYLSLDAYMCGEERPRIDIIPLKEDYIKYCYCIVFLLDSEGKKTECGRNEITFIEKKWQKWEFPLSFTIDTVMRNKTQYLPDDTLTLKCEFIFTTGIEYEGIEDTEFGNVVSVDRKVSKFPSALEELACLYKEGTLCDITLQTETESFKAHKIILCARSSVFKTMFSTDMREKKTDCVIIEDLDADTVRRMLLYLYEDTVEDLDWEKARNLHVAAHKYNIAGLEHRCSVILKNGIEAHNCCEILLLADRQHDEDMKEKVQEYIEDYREEILFSEMWKNFEKSNPLLAVETFRAVFLKNQGAHLQ